MPLIVRYLELSFSDNGYRLSPSIRHPAHHSSLQRLHSRTRDSVAVEVVVDINQHTRISPLVESRRARATGNLRPGSTNQQVHALRVILRPIVAPTRMQRNNLMPQHISPRLQTRRNRHRPRIVRGNQIVRSPSPRRGSALEADLVDFGEFERGFVGGGAVVVGAGGQVVEDGALVAGRPGVPEELHGLAGDDGDVRFAGLARFVADDVGGLVAVGGDLCLLVIGEETCGMG